MVMKINGTSGYSILPPVGQCYLEYSSATACVLWPWLGNVLSFCDGNYYPVPSSGVTLSNSGLAASTFYYVYAYMNSGTMTLEASTTGHSTDTTYGIEIKTGDSTRTLVGAVYTNGSTQFADSLSARNVVSWFNAVIKPISIPNTSAVAVTSTSVWTPVTNAASFIVLDDAPLIGTTGISSIDAGNYCYFATELDLSLSPLDPGGIIQQAGSSAFNYPFSTVTNLSVAEGRHQYRLIAKIGSASGNATFNGAASATTGRCVVTGSIKG